MILTKPTLGHDHELTLSKSITLFPHKQDLVECCTIRAHLIMTFFAFTHLSLVFVIFLISPLDGFAQARLVS